MTATVPTSTTSITCARCPAVVPIPAKATIAECPKCRSVYRPTRCSECHEYTWMTGEGSWVCPKCHYRANLITPPSPLSTVTRTPKSRSAPEKVKTNPNRTKARVAWGFLGLLVVAAVVIGATAGVFAAVFFVAITFGLLIGVAKALGDRANTISKVGVQTLGGLACPKCKGTNFTAKRSAGGKVGLGLLAPKTRVRCVTCGATYTRG
jgi:DNA-directed RNA polymerase subunit RPC12/RpoP